MSDYTLDEAFGESKVPWWFLLVEGIAAIIIGILLLMNPHKMSVLLVQILAIYWLIKGIISLVSLFVDRSAWGWKLFIGIVGIIAGYILIQNPLVGTVTVANVFVIVLGIQGIIIGIVELVQAFQGAGWGVGVLGAVTTIIGIWLLANVWAAARVLPWVLGIVAIIGGIVAIVYSVRFKKADQEAEVIEAPPEEEPEAEAEVDEPAPAAKVEEEVAEEAAEEAGVEEAEEPAAEAVVEEAPEEMPKGGHDVTNIEGIGPKYGQALNEQGIDTTLSLLEAGATPSGRQNLAEKTGISNKSILTWVNHADLMRVKGIGGQYAELLEAVGVDTVPELARRNPGNLHGKMVEVNQEKQLVGHTPGEHEVGSWVAEAKDLPRVVKY